MINDFKAFIMRGNVIDLAVAVIIGAAFGAIISSFVADLLMPILSLVTGGVDFSNLFWALDGSSYPTLAAAKEAGAATLNYGIFITSIFNFLMVALGLFAVVKAADKFKKDQPAPAPAGPTAEEKLLGEIRDLLAKK